MKKLKPLLIQSQRDNRWGSILLGNNTISQYNIYNYGCLITSFGNYIGQTPAEVNTHKDMFVAGGGDFIWSKCTSIGLNNKYTSPRFEDAVPDSEIVKMKGFIDQGYPLITEVDFNPSTVSEEQHYVLIIGYDDNGEFIILDPWTGSIVSLAVYGGVHRAMYMYRVYDKVLAFEGVDTSVDTCPAELAQVKAERDHLNDVIRVDKDPTILNLNKQISDQNSKLSTLQGTISNQETLLLNDKTTIAGLTIQANKVSELTIQVNELTDQVLKRDGEISTLKTQNGTLTTNMEKLKSSLVPKKYLSQKIYNLLMALDGIQK